MNIPAILRGALFVILAAVLTFMASWIAGIEDATAPQLITVTALWIVPGLLTGLRVHEAGTLHGLLAGLLGGAVLYLTLPAVSQLDPAPTFLRTLSAESRPLFIILAGWWGGFGGLVADNRRLIGARRAAKKQQKQHR